jgi:hypothetical protein
MEKLYWKNILAVLLLTVIGIGHQQVKPLLAMLVGIAQQEGF